MSPAKFLSELELRALLKVQLKATRYEHTCGVVETADAIAAAHGLDVHGARLAAWLHDSAKSLSVPRLKALARQGGADASELASPSLWHAPAGSALAQRQFGVKDKAVIQAIRFHTTGTADAGPLAKVIFVADYCEPGRRYEGTKKMRKLGLSDLNAAYREVLREKLAWVVYKRQTLHPRSVDAYNQAVRHTA